MAGEQDLKLMRLLRAIAEDDERAIREALAQEPSLARAALSEGASRADAAAFFLAPIGAYAYEGTTALHVAAAAHRPGIAQELLALGASARAKDRRGCEPIHAAARSFPQGNGRASRSPRNGAAAGSPGSERWDPRAQARTIACLVDAGADPNAPDKRGVLPLHVAARTRSAAAVAALLERGADPTRANKNGSTPLMLAKLSTGRGGAGSPEAKAQQREIVRLLGAD